MSDRMTIAEVDKLYPNWRELTQWRPIYKTNPLSWKSEVTNKEYDYKKYANVEKKDEARNLLPLPKDGYPYTIVHEEQHIPLWLENTLKFK